MRIRPDNDCMFVGVEPKYDNRLKNLLKQVEQYTLIVEDLNKLFDNSFIVTRPDYVKILNRRIKIMDYYDNKL